MGQQTYDICVHIDENGLLHYGAMGRFQGLGFKGVPLLFEGLRSFRVFGDTSHLVVVQVCSNTSTPG